MPDVILEPAGDPVSGMPTAGAPAPAPDPTAPDPTAPDPTAAPAAADDPDAPQPGDGDDLGDGDDPNEPEPAGRRTVVGDLVRERERRQTAERQAEQAQQLLRGVMARPEGMALLQQVATGAPATPPAPEADPELQAEIRATAEDLGLYDAEGQLDLTTAGRIVSRQQALLQRQLQREIAPVRQQALQPMVQQAYQNVLAAADHYGIDRETVINGLRSLPPDQVLNPQVQQAVLMTAYGLQVFTTGQLPAQAQPRTPGAGGAPQRVPGVPRPGDGSRGALRPPVYSESPGGRPRSAPVLDDAFRARLRDAGMQDTDIDSSLSSYVPGAPNKLE